MSGARAAAGPANLNKDDVKARMRETMNRAGRSTKRCVSQATLSAMTVTTPVRMIATPTLECTRGGSHSARASPKPPHKASGQNSAEITRLCVR